MNMTSVDLSITGYLNALWDSTYNGSLWYIRNLLILIIFTPLLYVLLKNYKNFPLGTFFLFFSFLYTFTPIHIFTYDRFDRNIYFFIGAYIAINFKELLYERHKKTSLYVLFICLVINCIPTDIEFIIFLRIIGTTYAVWFLPLDPILNIQPKWYMKISFFIYCAHSLILETFEKGWYLLAGRNTIAAFIDYIFMPYIVITFIIFLSKFTKKIYPPLWNTLSGGRG